MNIFLLDFFFVLLHYDSNSVLLGLKVLVEISLVDVCLYTFIVDFSSCIIIADCRALREPHLRKCNKFPWVMIEIMTG